MLLLYICSAASFILFVINSIVAKRCYRDENIVAALIFVIYAMGCLAGFITTLICIIDITTVVKISTTVDALIKISRLW